MRFSPKYRENFANTHTHTSRANVSSPGRPESIRSGYVRVLPLYNPVPFARRRRRLGAVHQERQVQRLGGVRVRGEQRPRDPVVPLAVGLVEKRTDFFLFF